MNSKRFSVLALTLILAVSVFVYHWQPVGWNILDLRWGYDFLSRRSGWQYPAVMMVLAASLVVGGGGKLSVDGLVCSWRKRHAATREPGLRLHTPESEQGKRAG